MIYIYKKADDNIKLLDMLNYTLEEFNGNTQGCYPNWDNKTMLVTDTEFQMPAIDEETQELREMTREEKILNLGMKEFLEDGEYIENKELITIDYPDDGNIYDWIDNKWIFNLEKTVEKKEVELNNIRLKMKSIIDEIEYSKNYGLYTNYSLNDLNTLKEKEFNLSLEIAMLMNK